MIDGMMLAESFQRMVAFEGIGVVDGTFSRFLSDDIHWHLDLDGLVVKIQIIRQLIRGLWLIESLDDGDLRPNSFQALLFLAFLALHIAPLGFVGTEGSAEDAFFPS